MAGLDELNRAAKLEPEDAETQFQLGAAYDQANKPKDVIQHMEATVRLDPADPSAWDYLALNLETAGEVELVEGAYKHGLSVNLEGPHFDSFLDYNYGPVLGKMRSPCREQNTPGSRCKLAAECTRDVV